MRNTSIEDVRVYIKAKNSNNLSIDLLSSYKYAGFPVGDKMVSVAVKQFTEDSIFYTGKYPNPDEIFKITEEACICSNLPMNYSYIYKPHSDTQPQRSVATAAK